MDSRVVSTQLLAGAVTSLDVKPTVFVCGSAMGYYGDRGDEHLTEEADAGDGFLSDVTQAWEAAAAPIAETGVRLAFARTSVVLDPDDGALPRMALLTKLCAGGPIGGGDQYLSWVTLDDEVRAIRHIIDTPDVSGPVNIAAGAVPQREFARALADQLRRPAFAPAPAFAIRAALGQMGEELLLFSIRVVPDVLTRSGFTFESPELPGAFEALYADRGGLVVNVTVDATPERVWAELEQIEQHTEWMRDASEIRFVGETRRGTGTTFECDTRVGPLTTTDVMEITAWEPRERMAVEHRGAVSGSGEFTLHPAGEGRTEIRWSEDLRFPWYFGGPAGARGSRPILRRLWQGNLQRLAARIA